MVSTSIHCIEKQKGIRYTTILQSNIEGISTFAKYYVQCIIMHVICGEMCSEHLKTVQKQQRTWILRTHVENLQDSIIFISKQSLMVTTLFKSLEKEKISNKISIHFEQFILGSCGLSINEFSLKNKIKISQETPCIKSLTQYLRCALVCKSV